MNPKPQVGQLVTVRGVLCRIFKVHPFGTVDVESLHSPAPSSQEPDPRPGNYYVSIRDGERFGLLAGPFKDNHAAALAMVAKARRAAHEADPWTEFASFGTVCMKDSYDKPGVLNDVLGLEA